MKIKIKKMHPDAKPPEYATPGAACFDLRAVSVAGSDLLGSHVWQDDPVTCRTGLAFEIPPGHVMLVSSRSGQGFKFDVRLANCVGMIDSDYRGEVIVKLTCDKDQPEHMAPYHVSPGDRVAQAMVLPIERVEFVESEELSETQRGTGGFGSTGAS